MPKATYHQLQCQLQALVDCYYIGSTVEAFWKSVDPLMIEAKTLLEQKTERAKRKPSQREEGPRAKFSVEKASEGGQSFADSKAALEAAGVTDVRRDYTVYVGQYGLRVPKRFEETANKVLFG